MPSARPCRAQILVVEKEILFARLFRAVLVELGHLATICQSREHALIQIAQTHPIDLAIVDLESLGDDGVCLIQALWAQSPCTSVIAFSGPSGLPPPLQSARHTGRLVHLTMPSGLTRLEETIDRILAIRHALRSNCAD